jgi:chromosome partitioning protein
MATFTIASAKGGCGKTTLAILLAAELALEGYTVTLLDCDLNQHATAFGAKAKISGLEITGNVTETNVLAELKKAEAASDLVLIDLPGGSSTLAIKALQRSHFVLVPTQASLMDVRDATKTIAQIDDAEELARSPIGRAMVWTRFSPGFESRSARHVRESLEGTGANIFRSVLLERAAFREIHISGLVPRQLDPNSGPALNIAAIATEVLERLKTIVEAAA